MTLTPQQRAMMAADLCDRAAAMLRRGDVRDAQEVLEGAAATLRQSLMYCADCYRNSLASADLAPADIDAAVAAVARGEHPADSLPGKTVAMVACAADSRKRWADDGDEIYAARFAGEGIACRAFLGLLGCEVTP